MYKIHVLVWYYSSTGRSDSLNSLCLLQEIITFTRAEETGTCIAYQQLCYGSLCSLKKLQLFHFVRLLPPIDQHHFHLLWIEFFFNLYSAKGCSVGKNCWMHLVCVCSRRWITMRDYEVERVKRRSALSVEKNSFLCLLVTEEIIKELGKIKNSFCFQRFQM